MNKCRIMYWSDVKTKTSVEKSDLQKHVSEISSLYFVRRETKCFTQTKLLILHNITEVQVESTQ